MRREVLLVALALELVGFGLATGSPIPARILFAAGIWLLVNELPRSR